MIQAKGSAGEGRISHGAHIETAGEHISLHSIAPRRNPRLAPARYPYDPNTDGAGRRCPSCGERSGWRRVLAIGGGWIHCGPTDANLHHGDLNHTCDVLCTLRASA